ncbi:hypothetical protein HYC85_011864 [Camellia sinensis]|uniref:Uncharacterized protein n=1 Tax=Camellia sinensis TaxID=4442 RepID=A0A7J7HC98_CAMSI|nr:hypothetical protein HYC85_011864 [Camellia sinensis]
MRASAVRCELRNHTRSPKKPRERERELSAMVDTKAEEDGDEGFGDFIFVSFASHALHSDKIHGQKSIVDYNDDEFGFFPY